MSNTVARPVAAARPLLASVAIVLALSILIAGSARVQVPFWPVPMTLQTLAVLTIAGFGGVRIAGAAMLAYLVEGMSGLPVFAGGGGLAYVAGPTGGYLIGMLAASVVSGALVRLAAGRALPTAAAMLLGTALVYVAGAAWLARFVGADRVLALGVLPFVAGDVVKALLATTLVLAAGRGRRA